MVAIIKDIKVAQSAKYNLIIVGEIRQFLQRIVALDEDALHARSKELQPSKALHSQELPSRSFSVL